MVGLRECNECGYEFPEELSEFIKNKKQVFCESCGLPFTIPGVKFEEDYFISKKPRNNILTKKQNQGLEHLIHCKYIWAR